LFFSIGYPVVSLGYGFKSYLGYKVKSVSTQENGLITLPSQIILERKIYVRQKIDFVFKQS